MAHKISPFLMFQGSVAEAAMRFYVSLFSRSKVGKMELYGANEAGPAGSVKLAEFTLSGQDIKCIDSPVKHAFDFTASMSLFVECESEAELDTAFEKLSAGGGVLMPPNNYGFSRKFAWVNDRFGVSWQLNFV